MSTIRSFLAIELTPEIKTPIKQTIQEFKKIPTDIKYVSPENLHLTLKFFGEINNKQLEEIKQSIKNTLKNSEPFNIKIQGMGTFPNKNHIKVIWIGLEENKTLTSLQKQLDTEFEKIGFKKEKNYKSHLTIGRMKTAKNKQKIKELVNKKEDLIIGKMYVNKIYLKKSTLTRNGPIYENLMEFSLS